MIKLVLLDRDGVLNKEIGDYVANVDDLEVLKHVIPNLLRLKKHGCKFVVITNQSGIAKRKYTHQILNQIHDKLVYMVGQAGIKFEEIYYCPHHHYYSNCTCRKPHSGMVEKALARFGFDASQAVMIGDTPRDVEAAEGAGVKGFKIHSNQNWSFVVDEIIAIP